MRPRVIVLGGGPIGLEAALEARELGWDAAVFERGSAPGHNVGRWGFVELFSPWKLNVTPLGLRALERAGFDAPDPAAYPTGAELRSRYLDVIAHSLGDAVRCDVEVAGVAREGLLKPEAIGAAKRRERPFRVLVRDLRTGRERYELGDAVIDATGVYDQPRGLGPGGLSLPGEASASAWIDRHIPDLMGADRDRYAGRSILLLGSGHSAATALESLLALSATEPSTRTVWVRRREGAPVLRVENDPLPYRRRLADLASRIAADPRAAKDLRSEGGVTVESIEPRERGVSVTRVRSDGTRAEEVFDRVLSLVGYQPNLDLGRELQVHLCYATEGPMKLAAALLGAGGGGDCLASNGFAGDTLRNPEPRYFIVGAKSYGRRNDFLLRTGYEQVREVFRLLEEDLP